MFQIHFRYNNTSSFLPHSCTTPRFFKLSNKLQVNAYQQYTQISSQCLESTQTSSQSLESSLIYNQLQQLQHTLDAINSNLLLVDFLLLFFALFALFYFFYKIDFLWQGFAIIYISLLTFVISTS